MLSVVIPMLFIFLSNTVFSKDIVGFREESYKVIHLHGEVEVLCLGEITSKTIYCSNTEYLPNAKSRFYYNTSNPLSNKVKYVELTSITTGRKKTKRFYKKYGYSRKINLLRHFLFFKKPFLVKGDNYIKYRLRSSDHKTLSCGYFSVKVSYHKINCPTLYLDLGGEYDCEDEYQICQDYYRKSRCLSLGDISLHSSL